MRFVTILLAVCGIVVFTLALRVHYSTEIQPCSINEKWDCGIVNHSRFSQIGHIPVAAFGIAGYALLALLAAMHFHRLMLAASLIGLAFALYLTHIEAHILQVWCVYCVISQAIIGAIALLSLGTVLLRQRSLIG